MTPKEAKIKAALCNCPTCKTIIENDFYISQKAGDGNDWRPIVVKYGPKPCQYNGCGKQIHIGANAYQKTGVGIKCWVHGA